MGWIIENLIGTKDGQNRTFTTSELPVPGSQTIVHGATRVRRVANMPSSGQPGFQEDAFQSDAFQGGEHAITEQYSIAGLTITMGRAPAAAADLWTRYFSDQ